MGREYERTEGGESNTFNPFFLYSNDTFQNLNLLILSQATNQDPTPMEALSHSKISDLQSQIFLSHRLRVHNLRSLTSGKYGSIFALSGQAGY